MARYFFNIYDDETRLDRDGTELAEPADVRAEALMLAGRLIAEAGSEHRPFEEWRLEVTDERGLVLIRMDLMVTTSSAFTPHEHSVRRLY